MNNGFLTRTLISRLVLLFSGVGIAIATLPGMDAAPSAQTATQVASRQALSVQLDAW